MNQKTNPLRKIHPLLAMRQASKALIAIIIVLGFAILEVLSCVKTPTRSDRLLVAASILPLMDFARQVGGDYVDAFAIVPPGVNPHTFELTPEVVKKISRAKLLILNGIGLEFWANQLLSNINRSETAIIYTAEGITAIADDEHAVGNPHVWLDPLLAIRQVEKICAALCQVDSFHAPYYRTRSSHYIAALTKLHQEISAETTSWRHRRFICFHPSWSYFAKRYGLVQAAVIEKRPGFEPNPREVAEIITTARTIQAKAIFAEQQFSIKASQIIADEAGAQVIRLDPLGSNALDFDYIQLLRKNVQQMALALK